MLYSTDYISPMGKILILSDGEAICGLYFYGQKHFMANISDETVECNDLDVFRKVCRWLDEYFRGHNPEINFKLNPQGTKFRKKVWKILSEIPYGETVTYGDIASKISERMSAQAVGGAVGANPIAIIIPCHRVIGADGRLTGYAGGISRKKELLEIEKSIF